MYRCSFLIFSCLLLQLHAAFFNWSTPPLPERAKRAQMVMEGLDERIARAIVDYNVPGIAVGVVVEGHLIYAKGFGFRDLEKKLPVTADTLFSIASGTKAFTAFTLGTLIDEGLMGWDQLVIDVLPEFRLFDQYATQNLTFRDLLTHRTGMPRHDFMWYNSNMTRDEVIRKIRYLEPACEFRERYVYGNLMYLTAGYAMEQVTKKSWETLVQERVLKPLEMKRTFFSVQEMQKDRDFSYPYIEKGSECKRMKFRDNSMCGPACSMHSSIHDLSHWMIMQLNQGVYKNHSLISLSTLQEMHTPQLVVSGTPEIPDVILQAYGIGWALSAYGGHFLISHHGAIDGFTSQIGLLPKEGIGVVVLSNRNLTSLPAYLLLQIIDRVLEVPNKDWIEAGLQGMNRAKETAKENKMQENLLRKKGTTPSHPLEQYVGDYEHPGYGIFSIYIDDGKLQATFNGITSPLEHWHYDVFFMGEETELTFFSKEGTKLSFHNNVSGEVEQVVVPLEPRAGDIVFKKKAQAPHHTLSYLKKFTGLYEIHGYTVEIAMRQSTLCAMIPGQPLFELVPSSAENEFSVKSAAEYTIRFILDSHEKVREVLVVLPYGAFSATPRNRG